MTSKIRIDKYSTKFGKWLREQEPIDSFKGYRATDLDYIWCNVNSGKWIYIEEKSHVGLNNADNVMKAFQLEIFRRQHAIAIKSKDDGYKGFYFVYFEKESPDDGAIYFKSIGDKNFQLISKQQLLNFLKDFKL